MNIRKIIREELKVIFDDTTISIKIGDKNSWRQFKNKKIEVKKISTNDKGDITINDKPFLRFRIPKNVEEGKATDSHINCENCEWHWGQRKGRPRILCFVISVDMIMKKNKFDYKALDKWKEQKFLKI